MDRHIELLAQDFKLANRPRSLEIRRRHQDPPALDAEHSSEFSRRGGFPSALQPHEHHHRGGVGRKLNWLMRLAHQRAQFFPDDSDNVLTGGEALQDLLRQRSGFDVLEKAFDDFIVDIGFQQCQTDIAEDLRHNGFVQQTAASQALENCLKLGGQRVPHVSYPAEYHSSTTDVV